jgi:hypothetical protein
MKMPKQDPDRWCSHSAWGQECWQLVSQWVCNLHLELGPHLHPDPVSTTEFAPALSPPSPALPVTTPPSGYAAPHMGLPWKAGRFSGQDFVLQPDGTRRFHLARSFSRMNSVEKLIAACVSCMGLAFAVATPVRCARSANGMAGPPRSRAR